MSPRRRIEPGGGDGLREEKATADTVVASGPKLNWRGRVCGGRGAAGRGSGGAVRGGGRRGVMFVYCARHTTPPPPPAGGGGPCRSRAPVGQFMTQYTTLD